MLAKGVLGSHWLLLLKNFGLDLEKQERRSRRNTLGCLDQYTGNMLRLWNSRVHETV